MEIKEAEMPSYETFELNRSPAHLLHRAQQFGADLHMQTFGTKGLTQRQTGVLAALGRGEALSQTQLVHATGIDRSTLAEMVARMETKGYLVRQRSETDARINSVTLSDFGREALVQIIPKLKEIDAAIVSMLDRDGQKLLLKGLAKIAFPIDDGAATTKSKKKKEKKKKEKKKTKQKNALTSTAH